MTYCNKSDEIDPQESISYEVSFASSFDVSPQIDKLFKVNEKYLGSCTEHGDVLFEDILPGECVSFDVSAFMEEITFSAKKYILVRETGDEVFLELIGGTIQALTDDDFVIDKHRY